MVKWIAAAIVIGAILIGFLVSEPLYQAGRLWWLFAIALLAGLAYGWWARPLERWGRAI